MTQPSRRDRHRRLQTGGQGSLRDRRNSAARPCAARRCMPGRSARSGTAPPDTGHAGRGRADLGARQHEVLVLVMAAGVNYNGVWAALGKPISPIDGHKNPYPHRRLRRLGHRLGRRLQGEALEGRRRGRRPLQPGRRRRRGVQRRRPDVLALASASGATRRRTAPSRSSAACRRASCWRAASI